MNLNESLFFQLLRGGLWQQKVDATPFENLTLQQWEQLFELSRQQALLGIVYEGICQLPESCQPPRALRLRWLMMVQRIENVNLQLNSVLAELARIFQKEGIDAILLKGQGGATFYAQPLRRQSGDIDLYFPTTEDFIKAQKWALSQPQVKQSEVIKHVSFAWKGAHLEFHRQLEGLHYLPADRLVRRYFSQQLRTQPSCQRTIETESVALLPPEMNLLYVMMHALNHFLSVGVGLRQFCDWGRLCADSSAQVDRDRLTQLLRQTHLLRLANAFAQIQVDYLGLDVKLLPFHYTPEPLSQQMLQDILDGGNFGFNRYKRPAGKWIGKMYTARMMVSRSFRFYRLSPTETLSYPLYYFIGTLRLVAQGKM